MKFDIQKRHHYWFQQISQIPRASYHEKQISDFICKFAVEHGLRYKQDEVWNVFVFKPASSGAENASPVILQAHMDMVPAKKTGSKHNFDTDPITIIEKDGWIYAKDTTLGADDGIGVAMMLAILEDDSLKHPPLECIFSVQEEVGLGGAMHMKVEDIQADRMISLDSMDHDVADLCCAGGCYVEAKAEMHLINNKDRTYKMHIGGLSGGHSGTDIHKEKGNANVIAARILAEAMEKMEVHIVEIQCDSRSNAIPPQTDVIFTSNQTVEMTQQIIQDISKKIQNELQSSDPDFVCDVTQIETAEQCADAATSSNLINFMYLTPTGFQHKSMSIEGLTVTSLNLGTITTHENVVSMQWLLRSMFDSAVEDLVRKIKMCGKVFAISVNASDFFTGWEYAKVSPIRDKFEKALEHRGEKLKKVAAHGGLEVGVFSHLHPGIDITTVGAVCRDYHTYDEKLNIDSFDTGFSIVKDILEQCTKD